MAPSHCLNNVLRISGGQHMMGIDMFETEVLISIHWEKWQADDMDNIFFYILCHLLSLLLVLRHAWCI